MKSIIMSTEDVRGILAERKTMTRRAIKGASHEMVKSKYQVGDVLWVRETWNGMCIDCGECAGDNVGYQYKADSRRPSGCAYEQSWLPPIFMPKEACRLFLRVTGVRAERLQEMPYDDCLKEGMWDYGTDVDTLAAFQALWDSLNAGYGWDTSPWVWVYTFERCEKPEGWCK